MPDAFVELEEKGLPPEGLWVSPDGTRISVIEHLIEIQHHPQTFGLTAREVKGASISDLHGMAVKLILDGWTRFRFLSGVWNFEVDSVKRRRQLIEDILVTHQAFHLERVVISQATPKRDYQGSVAQFYDQSMFRHYELGRSTWRVT
jgi:hypothetical protein